MKKKLIFTAFLITLALQFFFPLKIVHDQYMARKYGAVETCAVNLCRNYGNFYGDCKISFQPSQNTEIEEFAVKDKELANFVNENCQFLPEAEAVVKVLGQTRALEDVLICGVSMKNPPDNALEILKAAAEKAKPESAAEEEIKQQPEAAPADKTDAPQQQTAPAAQGEATPSPAFETPQNK